VSKINNIIREADINLFKKMLIYGTNEISNHYEYINELNVFPIPDGDTGTNLKITTQGGIEKINNVNYNDFLILSKQYNHGLLMNARGNSGVIFTQIMRGFTSIFESKQKKIISIDDFITAFSLAKSAGYSAVSNPVEGTILTVVRIVSEKINTKKSSYKTLNDLFIDIVSIAEEALAKTPTMLKILKDAKVVDSGGYGLVKFLTGMKNALFDDDKHVMNNDIKKSVNVVNSAIFNTDEHFIDNNEGFGYCTEFIITIGAKVAKTQDEKKKFEFNNFKKELEKFGNSIVIINDDKIVKVHIHTIEPYKVLEFAAKFGEFNKIKIENMTEQFLEKKNHALSNEIRVIATVQTNELKKNYKDKFNIINTIVTNKIGNPSVQNFVEQIENTNSRKIIIVTDDSNIILAAKEASKVFYKKRLISLIECINPIESYIACLAFNNESDYYKNVKNMVKNAKMKKMQVIKIAKSVKNIRFGGTKVEKNDYIGIAGKNILFSSNKICVVIDKILNS
jgi:DAK2 domain fusion protein YloV